MTEQPRYRTHIGLSEIKPSPTNPRKHFNEAELAELAASIKKHGVITPIMIRLINDLETPHLYEIVAGERRWRAATLAGLTTIPAIVRDDLSPAAIIEIQLIENLQRQDLHPLEEAEGYGRMMREHGYTADTLAEKIGKSRSYIFGRMKLLDLSDDARRLFYAGLLNPSTALLIARIPTHKLQAKAVEDITEKDYHGDSKSVRAAARHIQSRYMTNLNNAPFPTDDGELIATAGPCGACPKRTGNAPELFDDVADSNVCTDPDCYILKKQANAERIAREAGPDVKVVTGNEAEKMLSIYGNETKTHAPLDSTCPDDPKNRTYREIIGDDAAAIILVENRHKGGLVPVIAKKIVTEKLKSEGVVTRAMATRDDNKKIKAQVTLENTFRQALFKTVREAAQSASTKIPVLEAMVAVITRRFLIDAGQSRVENVSGIWGAIGHHSFDRADAFRKGVTQYSTDEQLRICLDLAMLAESHTDEHNLKRKPEGLLTMASALDIDADALLKEAKESLKPAPKPAKKLKKTPPAPSEDHLPPTQAAPAAGIDRAKSEVGATEAAPAGEETPPEKATAEEQKSAASAAVEEPSGGERPFDAGDVVHVIGGPLAGSGKGGEIECVYTDDRAYPYVVKIDGQNKYFAEDELKLVAKAEAIETDEKTPVATRRPVQYRHPNNHELEWTGRGRKPKWVEAYLANGGTMDSLKTEGVAA